MDPIAMTTLIGASLAALAFLVVLAVAAVVSYRTGCLAKKRRRRGRGRGGEGGVAATAGSDTAFYPSSSSIYAGSAERRSRQVGVCRVIDYTNTAKTATFQISRPPAYGEDDDDDEEEEEGMDNNNAMREPPVDYANGSGNGNGSGINGNINNGVVDNDDPVFRPVSSFIRKRTPVEPTYPLPPPSRFPLGAAAAAAGFSAAAPRKGKTPQNRDLSPASSAAVLYADLQFPKTSNAGSTAIRCRVRHTSQLRYFVY